MKLIVGLGNPGAEYVGTRHNIGFEVIDALARRHSIAVAKRNFKAVYGEGMIGGEKILLMRPMTYMNLSGEAVSAITRFYKIETPDIIIVLDDIALAIGRLRLRFKGSSGGQNGLDNIIKHLGTQEVLRVRIGVGNAPPGDMRGHVLSRFRKEEMPLVEEAVQLAADSIECAIKEGFDIAMNRFNIPDAPPDKEKGKDKDKDKGKPGAENAGGPGTSGDKRNAD